jgi:hypothetical protein
MLQDQVILAGNAEDLANLRVSKLEEKIENQ